MTLRIVAGPKIDKVSRIIAEQQLLASPEVPSGADYVIEEINGHWAAAFVEAKDEDPKDDKKDEPKDEAKDDDSEKSEPKEDTDKEKTSAGPGAPDEGPLDGAAPMDEAPLDPESPEEEKPRGSDLDAKVDKIEKSLDKIIHALGIGEGGDEHDGPVEPPMPPEGLDGPPAPPKAPKAPPHAAPMKPGVSPPAFASVSEDHPWHEQITAGVSSFEVEEEISADEKISGIVAELAPLIEGSGYRVAKVSDRLEGDRRLANVTIEAVSTDGSEV